MWLSSTHVFINFFYLYKDESWEVAKEEVDVNPPVYTLNAPGVSTPNPQSPADSLSPAVSTPHQQESIQNVTSIFYPIFVLRQIGIYTWIIKNQFVFL